MPQRHAQSVSKRRTHAHIKHYEYDLIISLLMYTHRRRAKAAVSCAKAKTEPFVQQRTLQTLLLGGEVYSFVREYKKKCDNFLCSP